MRKDVHSQMSDGDGALGDNAKLKLRIYLPSAFPDGGVHQVDYVTAYAFTALFLAAFAPGLLKLAAAFSGVA